jgi:AcrR family transcriptional regulator
MPSGQPAPGSPAGQQAPPGSPAGQQAAPGRRRRGPAPRHTRQEVVRAAVAIADAEGLDAVTIRAVSGRLGTGVMSLYNYVPDKQTLVYDMVEEVSGELDLPEPSGDWRADMHLLARRQREVVRRHPWMIEATRTYSRSAPPSWRCWSGCWASWSPPG